MAKIYLWEPTGQLYGHCSLMLDDGFYVSFWPTEPYGQAEAVQGKTVNSDGSTYDEDVKNEKRDPTSTLPVKGKLDNDAIRDWWNKNKNCGYNLAKCNCLSMVEKALEVGKLDSARYIMTPNLSFN
jgi:hypothetical protein